MKKLTADRRLAFRSVSALGLLFIIALGLTARFSPAQSVAAPSDPSFEQFVKPFLTQNCQRCHNVDNSTAGVRVDLLDSHFEDNQVKVWEAVQRRVRAGTMPPKGLPQPTAAETPADRRVDRARTGSCPPASGAEERPGPAPDRLAISEHPARIAAARRRSDRRAPPGRGLQRRIPEQQGHAAALAAADGSLFRDCRRGAQPRHRRSRSPSPRFRTSASISARASIPAPMPEKLVLGRGSASARELGRAGDATDAHQAVRLRAVLHAHQISLHRRLPGNDTVRGWREYDSIYHAVFADMRGSPGYPKGSAYSTVPQGLLAAAGDSHRGNVRRATALTGRRRISRSRFANCPTTGRFRVTVTAAKYNDGLLLDPGAAARTDAEGHRLATPRRRREPSPIPQGGHLPGGRLRAGAKPPAPDASRLSEGLGRQHGRCAGRLEGDRRQPGRFARRQGGVAHRRLPIR